MKIVSSYEYILKCTISITTLNFTIQLATTFVISSEQISNLAKKNYEENYYYLFVLSVVYARYCNENTTSNHRSKTRLFIVRVKYHESNQSGGERIKYETSNHRRQEVALIMVQSSSEPIYSPVENHVFFFFFCN